MAKGSGRLMLVMKQASTHLLPAHLPDRKQVWRWLLPSLFVLLFLVVILWLPWRTQKLEASERQEQLIADSLWVEQTVRFQLERDGESIRLLARDVTQSKLSPQAFSQRANALANANHEWQAILWLDKHDMPRAVAGRQPVMTGLAPASKQAAERARKTGTAQYSQPAAPPGMHEPELLDYYVPLFENGKYQGSLIARYRVAALLDEMVPWWFAQDNEILLTDNGDTVFARRAAGGPGRGIYTHQRSLDLPGTSLWLHTNSVKGAPRLLPNLLVGSVIVLAIGLLWSLWALWRDIARRLAAEGALRQQVAFRSAMENSLVTGLRARNMEGRVTYVNPAFCQMLGLKPEDLLGKLPPMPYWAPEAMENYQRRFAQVLNGTVSPQGFETVFQRANGERFPVLIFEAPLVDDSGKQTGWMGSILDISERKQAEDLARRQQEQLQASARLASMGEIASTLAHELNQPLAAISSYTTGALNLLQEDGKVDAGLLRQALEKAGAQAQRAGQIIRSVHEFVKKREPSREPVTVSTLLENVLPLIELQARQHFVTIQNDIAPNLPPLLADRILLEQVLLNLTRNAIEAMQQTAPDKRLLKIAAELDGTTEKRQNVAVSVIDQGHGIDEEVGASLYSPFFSTKAQGMGMGLNICRSAIEFHGGTLSHMPNPQGGTIFRFSLPAADVK